MKVSVCDSCDMSVFEGETACTMCGGTVFSDSGMSEGAATMLYLIRQGHTAKDAAQIVFKAMLQRAMADAVKKLLEKDEEE